MLSLSLSSNAFLKRFNTWLRMTLMQLLDKKLNYKEG